MNNTHLRLAGIFVLAALSLRHDMWAQQNPPASSQEQAESSSASAPSGDDRVEAEKASAIVLPSTPPGRSDMRQLGTARRLLGDQRGLLRWGRLYIQSAEFLQMVGDFNDPKGQKTRNVLASTFRTNLVYDKPLRRGRLSFQYQPHLFIIDGRVLRDFANQSAAFDWSQELSPRWSMGITDLFTFYSGRNRFGGFFLSSDVFTGETLQNPFLDLATNLISNRSLLSFRYQMSRRTWLSLGPSFSFSEAFGPERLSTRNQIVGMGVTLNHSLTATKVIQLAYSAELSRFSRNFDNRFYQSFGVGYSQLVGRSLWVHVGLGASTATTHGIPGRRDWTPTASAGLVKSFRSSALTATYQRSYNLGGYLTNRYVDRFDLGYNRQLTRKWQAALGFGFLHEDATVANVSGRYATAQVSYPLLRNVRWFASASHKWQRGDEFHVTTGNRNVFVTGIRWEARSPGLY